LLFNIGGKMYALLPLEPAPVWLTFKCTEEEFAALVDQPGGIPAPYLARAKWVALETEQARRPSEIKRLLRQSYDLVLAKRPKRTRETLGAVTAKVPARRKN
jgi:predicted DNA-binding protein (MmcQ/YjbR family)